MTNVKTITIRTEGQASEKQIFNKLKEFLTDNLWSYSLEVSGYHETLRYKSVPKNTEEK